MTKEELFEEFKKHTTLLLHIKFSNSIHQIIKLKDFYYYSYSFDKTFAINGDGVITKKSNDFQNIRIFFFNTIYIVGEGKEVEEFYCNEELLDYKTMLLAEKEVDKE